MWKAKGHKRRDRTLPPVNSAIHFAPAYAVWIQNINMIMDTGTLQIIITIIIQSIRTPNTPLGRKASGNT